MISSESIAIPQLIKETVDAERFKANGAIRQRVNKNLKTNRQPKIRFEIDPNLTDENELTFLLFAGSIFECNNTIYLDCLALS